MHSTEKKKKKIPSVFKCNKDEWFPHLILQTKHAFESTYFMIKCLCWLYNVVVEYVKQRPVARKEIIAHPYFTFFHKLWAHLELSGHFVCLYSVNKGGDGLIHNQGPIRKVDYITHQPLAHLGILLKELQKVLPCWKVWPGRGN